MTPKSIPVPPRPEFPKTILYGGAVTQEKLTLEPMSTPHVLEHLREGLDTSVATIRCPVCNGIGTIDEDQYHGRVSIDCPRREYHGTVGLSPGE